MVNMKVYSLPILLSGLTNYVKFMKKRGKTKMKCIFGVLFTALKKPKPLLNKGLGVIYVGVTRLELATS